MTKNDSRSDRPRPYLIAAVVVAALANLGLFVWIASLPVETLSHDDKVLSLLLLIALPGKPTLDWTFKRFGIRARIAERLSGMALVGVMVGLVRTEGVTGVWAISGTFVVAFTCAAAAFLVIDVTFDAIWTRWKSRKGQST